MGGSDKTLKQRATKLTASQRQNQSTLPRIADANLSSAPTKKNLQPKSATSLTRDADYRLVLTEESSHPTQSDMSKPPYTMLLRVRILARADCTHGAPQRAQHQVPHQRQMQLSQNYWLHHLLVTDGTLSPCSRPSKAFANAAVGLFKWIAQRSNLT